MGKIQKALYVVLLLTIPLSLFGCFVENNSNNEGIDKANADSYVFFVENMLRTWDERYAMLERGITPTSEELNERYQEGLVSIHKAYDMDLFDEQQRDEALAKHEEERGKPDSEYDLRITHILEESILTVKRFDVPAKHSKSHKTLEFAMDQLLLSVEAIRKSDYDVADQYLAVALKYIETWETIFRAE